MTKHPKFTKHHNHEKNASLKEKIINTLNFQNFVFLGQTEPRSKVANKDPLTKFALTESLLQVSSK